MHIEDLERVTPANGYYDVREQLRRHIYRRSEAAFLSGDSARDAITTPAQLQTRQRFIREHFIASIGGLPTSETPLQPKSFGEVRANGFKIEKILFQSRPNVYVTANLYVPDNLKGKTGAVLFVCGHAREAKTYSEYQIVCQHFALAGLVAFAIDPVGQGERLSYWDHANNRSIVEWGVQEHDHVGAQCLPLGWSLARFFVHDAMRAIDYLSTRPEVDASRIGVTGNSGGGTQTSLMMLCDPRIAAAAPGTFIMNRETFMNAGSPQDAEQIWPDFSSVGLDHEDILLAVCPKPVKVLACTSDFFPIEGARRTVNRVKRLWEMCGRAGDVGIAEETNVLHAYTPTLAKASAAMFAKALRGAEVESDDSRIKPFANHELWISKSGYIQHEIPGAVAVFETVKARTDELKKERQGLPPAKRRERAVEWLEKKVFANRKPCDLNPRFYREGDRSVEGLDVSVAMWWSQEGIFTGGFLFRRPEDLKRKVPVTLAIWDRGTRQLQRHWGFIEKTCTTGRAVLALDVSGSGAFLPNEITHGVEENFGALHKLTTDLIFLGDDLASMRVYDTIRALDMIEKWQGLDASDISVYAHGREGFYGRVAKALDPRIKSIEVVKGETIADWTTERLYDKHGIYSVAMRGALEYFDVDEL